LVTVAGSLPIRKSTYRFGGGGILHLRSSGTVCLFVCAYVLRASGTDLPQTQTESDSARAELRESRDSAHDCQSRELRSRTTHAGVITICTVPEMLPETWTRGDDVKRGGSVLSCHFSQRLSIRTRTPPCPSPSPSSPPCASPPSRSRAATLPPG
jgi:hypothetical protein